MVERFQGKRTRAKPGEVLKARRIERGWTLAEVSQRTGLSVSALSKVENDKMVLTYDRLVRLSEGLEIDFARLFNATSAKPQFTEGGTRRSVTRAGAGSSVEMPPRGNYLYLATDLLNKRMVPMLGEVFVKDIAQYDEFMRHPGEEFVFVIEGTLELHTKMYTPIRLEKGDTVYFDSDMEHAYVAVGEEPCRFLSVCSGESTTHVQTSTSAPKVIRPSPTHPSPVQPSPKKPSKARAKRSTRRSA